MTQQPQGQRSVSLDEFKVEQLVRRIGEIVAREELEKANLNVVIQVITNERDELQRMLMEIRQSMLDGLPGSEAPAGLGEQASPEFVDPTLIESLDQETLFP